MWVIIRTLFNAKVVALSKMNGNCTDEFQIRNYENLMSYFLEDTKYLTNFDVFLKANLLNCHCIKLCLKIIVNQTLCQSHCNKIHNNIV